MKKIGSLILALGLCLSLSVLLASCDDSHEHIWGEAEILTEATPTQSGLSQKTCTVCGATEQAPISFAGISESKWNAMLSDAQFENYTLSVEGTMTVTQGNESPVTSDTKSVCKMAGDQMELFLYAAEEVGGTATLVDTILLEGELAQMQKAQYSQLFLCILREYESFVYQPETKSYKVTTPITINTTLKGFKMDSDGSFAAIETPATIEMKNAEATLSEDGKILKLVCDYTQAMHQGADTPAVTTSGITTWTFSDYGTTVIGSV